jgi:hypothetical protein
VFAVPAVEETHAGGPPPSPPPSLPIPSVPGELFDPPPPPPALPTGEPFIELVCPQPPFPAGPTGFGLGMPGNLVQVLVE